MILSLILPSYNVGEYIGKCIQSVLEQTFSDIEILCVDAGSTDGTLEIIEKYAGMDDRVRLIHSSKKSYGYQINLGIQRACGEYVQIVETDDYPEPDACEKLVGALGNEQYDIVKGEYYVEKEYANGYRERELSRQFADDAMYNRVVDPRTERGVLVGDSGIWRGIYRRKLIVDNNILLNETPGAAYQDIGFLFRTAVAAGSIKYIKDGVYNYRVNRPGSSSVNAGVLEYCKYEYECLLNDFENGFADSDIVLQLYVKLISSFVGETNRLIMNGKDVDRSTYEWFVRIIAAELKNQSIDGAAAGDLRNILKMMIAGYDEYISSYEAHLKSIGWKSDRPIVVFGSGSFGKSAVEELYRFDHLPVIIADNAESVIGSEYKGIKIVTPEGAVAEYPDALYLAASKYSFGEMKQQLLELGVNEDNISIYSLWSQHEQ